MDYVDNIASVFHQATQPERESGLIWYDAARSDAEAISLEFEIPVSTVVGVIAALSPNNRWSRNLINARDMVRAYLEGEAIESVIVSTYKAMRDKAWSILADSLVSDDAILTRLKGQKIRSFYSNIIGLEEVTVDGHALNIAKGERVELTSNKTNIGKRLYKDLQSAYIQAAEQAGIEPRQMQAITWVTWRRIPGIDRGDM